MKLAHLALAIACAFALSCSDAAPTPATSIGSTEEQSQAATTLHLVQNGSVSLPWSATKFCRMTMMSGTGGHAGSPTWPNGKHKFGAAFSAYPPSLNAYPHNNSLGTATATAYCNDFSDFSFGPSASQSGDAPEYYFLWNTSYGQDPVWGTMSLWNHPAGFCYLNGVGHMSHGNETAHVYPSGGLWYLAAYGYPTMGASAKCIFPNRSFTISATFSVTPGDIKFGPLVGNSVCAFTKISGSLDDGWAQIRQQSGRWAIETSGVSAEMTCAVF